MPHCKCYFNNGRYIVIKNHLTLFHFFYEINEFSYLVLYCISLQELKCYIEHECVVLMRACLEYMRRRLFSRGSIRLGTNSDLSKECHDLSQSAGWHEKDCYFNNGKSVRGGTIKVWFNSYVWKQPKPIAKSLFQITQNAVMNIASHHKNSYLSFGSLI